VNARKRAFLGIAIAYGKAGYSDQAVKLATSIGNRDATFRGIVRHYLNSGQYDQAFEIIQQWNFKDMLSEVAFGYLETGQPERALQITLSIQPPPDATHKDWRFSAIARGFAKQGKFDQALQVAQAITDKSYKAQALTAIAEQYVAREREKKGPIEKIFFVLTNSYNSLFGSSNKDKASKILDQALQVAQSMAPKRVTQ
jgi:tetratricopeptide (TPR) repeat protein